MLSDWLATMRVAATMRAAAARFCLVLLAVTCVASCAGPTAGMTAEDEVSVFRPPPLTSVQSERVVVVGDSITGGSEEGGVGPQGWPALVFGRLKDEGFRVESEVSGRGGSGYVNPGVAGDDFGEMTQRLVREGDDLVVFFGSINDAMEPLDRVRAAAGSAYAHVRDVAPEASIVVIGPQWTGPPPPPITALRDTLRDVAAQYRADFVDPLAEQWLWSEPALIGADGVHPTDAGHEDLARLIEPHISSALTPSQ